MTSGALGRAVLYVILLPPIVLIYGTRERALITALPVGLIGALLVAWFERHSGGSPRRVALYAAVVGLVLAELTWILGYWVVPSLVGGAALWLALYAVVGVAGHALAGALTRRIAAEYGAVALLGLLVVLARIPWRP